MAFKQSKSGRQKSVVTNRPLSGVRISEASPLQTESSFEGLADLPIPDFVFTQHDVGLDELQHTLDVSESLTTSVVDTSGWSGGLHIHTLFTALCNFDRKSHIINGY